MSAALLLLLAAAPASAQPAGETASSPVAAAPSAPGGAGSAQAPPQPEDEAPPRRPGAGLVVRSREYVVRRDPPQEEFIGDVRYREGDREVRADWALLERERGLWQMKGRTRLAQRFTSGEVLEASGERARHDSRSGAGRLEAGSGLVRVLLAAFPVPPPGPPRRAGPVASGLDWESLCPRVDPAAGTFPDPGLPAAPSGLALRACATAGSARWEEKAGRAWLEGGVRVWAPDGENLAREAVYEHETASLHLKGRRPVLRRWEPSWEGAVQSDEVRLRRASPQALPPSGSGASPSGAQGLPPEAAARVPRGLGPVKASGGVKGWLIFRERDKLLRRL